MRTRVFDYLWGGLPIITSAARGTDEIIDRYECGVVIEDNDPNRFAEAIVTIFEDRKNYDRMVEGAKHFVADHQWRDLARPLLDFLANPRIEPSKERYGLTQLNVEAPTRSVFERIKRKIGGES